MPFSVRKSIISGEEAQPPHQTPSCRKNVPTPQILPRLVSQLQITSDAPDASRWEDIEWSIVDLLSAEDGIHLLPTRKWVTT